VEASDQVADVEPLDVTGVRTVTVGTVLFFLAGLALLPFHGWLVEHDRVWWLWTCATGFGLGLFGCWYCRRRARHLAEVRNPGDDPEAVDLPR
jgi:type VI protein secretion system component VasK